ncbi:MAG: alpha/beta fold hydrolase [Cyanobacteriota bacterium]
MALVALHGWLLSGQLWQPLERALPDRAVLAPDLPGFGTTPRPRGLQPSLASYGRWVADWVQREVGRERPVVLMGHSLGGSVVLHAAAHLEEQLRGVVQISVGGGVYQPRPFRQLRRVGTLLLGLRPRGLAHWPLLSPLRSPLLADPRAARGLLACGTNRGAVRQLPRLAHALSVPSLWIVGSRDQVMAPRYVRHLAGYAAAHQLEVLDGAGHLPMVQNPGAVAALIEAWLDQEVQNVASPFSCSSANWA